MWDTESPFVNSIAKLCRDGSAGAFKTRKSQRFAVWFFVLAAVVLTTASLVVSTPVSAASVSWNGSVSSDWNDANNWTPVGVPASSDDVTISSSTNEPSITIADVTVRNLFIGSGRTLTLGGGRTLTVDGTSVAVSFSNFGSIAGSGTLRTEGDIDFDNRGSVTAAFSVNSTAGSVTRV